uniref:Gypsy retrotransposon integrase-like protein 1 n=1 Tax=Monopterus albus TaxID=43700 RepID=A0A3Q3JTK4_MONAL
ELGLPPWVAYHPGVHLTISLQKRYFCWPTLEKDAREYVATCAPCVQSKPLHQSPAGLLQPLTTPSRPWSHIALDFVTGLPPSHGNTVILTIVDRFSKAAHFLVLPQLPSALETAQLLVQHVFHIHGTPITIVSDRGPQFTSHVWSAFCTALGARPCLSSGYHPQTNGQAERLNLELENALSCVTSSSPEYWSQLLPWVEYAHNTLSSSATGISPFQASLGYQPPLLSSAETVIAVPSVHAHISRCQAVWSETRAALLRIADQNKRLPHRRRRAAATYQAGQRVWL